MMTKFVPLLLAISSVALGAGRIRDADIAPNAAIAPSKIAAGNWAGNAATATELAASPTQCPGGQYATGIDTFANLVCAVVNGLPTQSGHAGEYLGTDGSTASWSAVVSGINQLTSDVTAGPGTGSQAATVVSVGGSTASLVHSAELAANAAASANTLSTIVKRDGSGNFSAGTITANLTGNVTGALTGNAATATAFDHTPTKCSAGNYPLGVDSGGNAVTCTAAASGAGDFSSNTSTSVDGEVVLFSGTGGKTGKRATGSGIAKLTSGVLGTATAKTDYWDTTNFTGDSGSGGVAGLVPAPSSGDAAAGKVLGAGGGWVTASGGGSAMAVLTKTSGYSILNGDFTGGRLLVEMNCSAACSATLPAASSNSGYAASIINVGTAVVTVALSGSDTFGSSADTTWTLIPGGSPQASNTFIANGGSRWDGF